MRHPSGHGGSRRLVNTSYALLVHNAARAAALAWIVCACTAVIACAQADPGERRTGGSGHYVSRSPLAPRLQRIDTYLQQHEVDGVTMDWRYDVSPSEEIRQTVVCQLLAYEELFRLYRSPRLREDIVQHADFMIGRLEEIRSHSPFDGMLAYALLAAYETAGEPRFLDRGEEIVTDLLAIPTPQCVLNGGLMVAMATAEYAGLTGNEEASRKTTDIIGLLDGYQNADGSFPHWCPGSRDIHYTGWMAMEMIHLLRMTHDARLEPYLAGMSRFLEGRIAPNGHSIYEEPCATPQPGCVQYYYSRASGCAGDYDTRGWTVEPVYSLLLFDHTGSPKYEPVRRFVDSLEVGGTFSDQYGWWPPPEDPEYPWTIADTSVVCMSINFWVLATQLAERSVRGAGEAMTFGDVPPAAVPAPRPPATLALRAGPNPTRGPCTLRWELPKGAAVSLDVLDVAGRVVRTLAREVQPPGLHTVTWDGRDTGGRAVASGVYFARLVVGDMTRKASVVVAR